jgi:hypothetical protein
MTDLPLLKQQKQQKQPARPPAELWRSNAADVGVQLAREIGLMISNRIRSVPVDDSTEHCANPARRQGTHETIRLGIGQEFQVSVSFVPSW